MAPPGDKPKDATKSVNVTQGDLTSQTVKSDGKSGASASSTINKTDGSTGASSSSTTTNVSELSPAQAAEKKLQDQQSDTVYNDVIKYLDWDNTHKSQPQFQPFFFFASQELSKANPDLQKLVGTLKAHSASRLVGDEGTETGQAWEFNDANLAGVLRAGMGTHKPALYLGYDIVTIDGTLRPCRVASQLSAA